MKKLTKGAALLSIVAAASLAFAGCSPAAPAETASPGTPRTLTFWNNATTGPGKAHWEALAKSFEEKHPGVTVKIQNIQNEDWDGKLQTALNSPDAPDVFMQRGGEKMVEMIRADLIQPVTDAVTPEIKTALGEAAFEGATYDGKIWAMTDLFQPGGMWYSEDLFKQAGITKLPETLPEFFETVKTLKAAGITPIALGAKDAWPAAHWYYWFALRECKTESLEKAATDRDFTDPCWLKAGQDLADLKALEPFQDGLLTTPAQQGAGSSAGLIANHKATMEHPAPDRVRPADDHRDPGALPAGDPQGDRGGGRHRRLRPAVLLLADRTAPVRPGPGHHRHPGVHRILERLHAAPVHPQ